jgi:hypothetical protein
MIVGFDLTGDSEVLVLDFRRPIISLAEIR